MNGLRLLGSVAMGFQELRFGLEIGGFDGLLFSVCGLMGPNMGLVQLAETLMNSETFTQRFTDLWPS